MKRQRNITAPTAEQTGKWESGEEDSDGEEDKFNKKGMSSQRDGRQRKKRKLTAYDASSSDSSTQVVGPVLYSPAHYLSSDLALSPYQEQDLHVYIPVEYLVPTIEPLRNEEIWGSNPYSYESDAVAILQHSGLYDVLNTTPTEDTLGIKLVLRIHPGATDLQGSERHGIRSKYGSAPVTLSALQFAILRDPNAAEPIEKLKKLPAYGPPRPERATATPSTQPVSTALTKPPGVVSTNSQSTSSSPTPYNHQMNSKRGHRRSKRHIDEIDHRVAIDVLPDTILQFNLSNELSFQYNLNLVCDRGIEPSQWTSHRLRNAVLMVETLYERYELAWEQENQSDAPKDAQYDTYRFSLVKSPNFKTRTWCAAHKVPLDAEYITMIHNHLDWSQFVWGPTTLTILGKSYPIRRMFWIARSTPPTPAPTNST